jgi:hypothetical protein
MSFWIIRRKKSVRKSRRARTGGSSTSTRAGRSLRAPSLRAHSAVPDTRAQLRLLMRPPPPPPPPPPRGLAALRAALFGARRPAARAAAAGPHPPSKAAASSATEAGAPAWVQQRLLLLTERAAVAMSHLGVLHLKEKLHEAALTQRLITTPGDDEGSSDYCPSYQCCVEEWGGEEEPAWQECAERLGPKDVLRVCFELGRPLAPAAAAASVAGGQR